LFRTMDEDSDGLIDFEDLAREHLETSETSRQFLNRTVLEKVACKGDLARQALLRTGRADVHSPLVQVEEMLEAEIAKGVTDEMRETARKNRRSAKATRQGSRDGGDLDQKTNSSSSDLLRDFATILFKRFPNMKAAFAVFDDSANGQISMSEFVTGAKHKLRFNGDLKAVFKEIDSNSDGVISSDEFKVLRQLERADGQVAEGLTMLTRKDLVEEKKQRDVFVGPGKHERGRCLASIHISQPLGEAVHSSGGFYSFSRTSTGRMDSRIHPSECPGDDPENTNAEHGPGFLEKGPGHHSESGHAGHPIRGNGWKVGANTHKLKRFAPLVPGRAAKEDSECRDASFCTYEGHAPHLAHKVDNRGATAMGQRCARMGPTFGNDSSNGLMAPRPIGPWAETRMGTMQLSKSVPSLLHSST